MLQRRISYFLSKQLLEFERYLHVSDHGQALSSRSAASARFLAHSLK